MGLESKVQNLLGHAKSAAFFGGEYTLIPEMGEEQAFTGIWSDIYITADPDTGVQVMSSEPNVGVRLSDFIILPAKNALIKKGEVRYKIRAVEADGEGGATLVLEKVKL
jgi:DNA gyrase inhibitor GyrI